MRGTAGQRKIVQTALVDPLVIEAQLEDAETLGRRIRAHRGDFLLNKHTIDVFSSANVSTLLATLAPKGSWYGMAIRFLRSLHHRGSVAGQVGSSRATCRPTCDPRHSRDILSPYLAVLVGVWPDGTMRDVRVQALSPLL